MDDFSWDQAYDGLGIRKVEDLAIPAYLSSLYFLSDLSYKFLQKFDLHFVDDAILQLIEEFPQGWNKTLNETLKKVQRNWNIPRIKSKFCEFFDSSDLTARERLLCIID